MPKNFVRRLYDSWIQNNGNRFRFPPVIAKLRKHGFTLQFAGLAPQLTFRVDQECSWGSAELFIHDERGVYWDIVGDFDLMEVRTPDGRYRCEWCDGGAALWEAHVFEPLLDWVNQRTADQWVCLYGTPEQTFWGARILSFESLAERDCVGAFPLMVGAEISKKAQANRLMLEHNWPSS